MLQDTYEYTDKDGNIRYKIEKHVNDDGKNYYPYHLNSDGEWDQGMGDEVFRLYRLHELVESDADRIFVVEGEKDVEKLRDYDFVATTNPFGAGSWEERFNQYFEGKEVIIIPDNDDQGHNHARTVARELMEPAEEVRIVELEELADGEDVTDWFEKDSKRTRSVLLKRISNTEPVSPSDLSQNRDSVDSVDGNDPIREGWGEIIPLRQIETQPIPTDVLPDWIQNYVESVAEFTQTPPALGCLISLSVCATALAKKAKIKVKEGYTEPLQLWTVTLLPPANRKSDVFSKLVQPIENHEQRESEEMETEHLQAQSEKELLEARLNSLRSKAANNSVDDLEEIREEIVEVTSEIEELDVPTKPTLTASDTTAKAVTELMAKNNGRIAILSPEGDIFKIMAGRYSDGDVNFSDYKKAWSGGEPIKEDRKTRESVRIIDPAITQGLALQPEVFRGLQNKKSFKGEGLLGRFLYGFPPSKVGHRKTGARVPELDLNAKTAYHDNMQTLLQTKPEAIDEKGLWKPHTVPLSEHAREIRDQFDAEIEFQLQDGGRLSNLRDWGGKLVGNTTRVAGLIHLANQAEEHPQQPFRLPVSGSAMRKAVQLGRALIPHARAVYDDMEENPKVNLSKYVLNKIEASYDGKLTKRDLYKMCEGKSEIQTVGDLEPILAILERHNFIKVQPRTSEGPGRNPSPIILPHPQVVEDAYNIDKIDRKQRTNEREGGLVGRWKEQLSKLSNYFSTRDMT
jgi:5S rRNA maturation endonuclease (ribonuclease M5)